MDVNTVPVTEWILLTMEISPEVIFQDLDGETVLLDMKTGQYYGLDDVSTRIWQLISKGNNLPVILKILMEEYEVDEKRCQQEIRTFLYKLQEKNLLDICRADI